MNNPAEFVRVSTPAGHFSVPAAVAAAGVESGAWKAMKQEAVDKNGNLLPPKLRDAIAAATPTKTEGKSSADSKEK